MGLACESEAKTDQETGANKHAHRLRGGLYGGSNAHDNCAQPHGPTTTETIGNVGGKGKTCQRTNILCTYGQETYFYKVYGWRCSLGWH